MNKERRAAIEKIADELDALKSKIEDLQNEEQEYYDNMPESIQAGEKGDAAQAAAEKLQEAADDLENMIDVLREATE